MGEKFILMKHELKKKKKQLIQANNMFHISTPDSTWCENDRVIVTLYLNTMTWRRMERWS